MLSDQILRSGVWRIFIGSLILSTVFTFAAWWVATEPPPRPPRRFQMKFEEP